jgi:MFS family permease
LFNALLRAIATGMGGVLLGAHLAELELPATTIGTVITTGLAGAAGAALLATLFGDSVGRRRGLIGLALLTAAGAVGFALIVDPTLLAITAFVGMINGMGKDRGAALILEQALLADTVTDSSRTKQFAVYNLLQDVGHALGSLAAAFPGWLLLPSKQGWWLYAALMLVGALIYRRLPQDHAALRRATPKASPETKSRIARLCALFAIDSLAGGFLTTALLSYFFFERFNASPGAVALLFFFARVLNALSHLLAAWLARRFGLVNTMVFTHIPSSLLLVTVAIAPNFEVAAILFLIREGFAEMDVPTRQSYVMAVVPAESRTLASGATNLVRMGAWAVGPVIAGFLMQGFSLIVPLVLGAAMKIGYDISLWVSFRSIRPPEERC